MSKSISIRLEGRDGLLTADSFIYAVGDILRILEDVDKGLSSDGKARARWELVGASMNTPATLTFAERVSDSANGRDIIGAVLDGIKQLEASPIRPRYFSDAALAWAKRLVSQLDNGLSSIEVSSGSVLVRPTQHAAANIDCIVGSRQRWYYVKTQLDGRIEELSIHGHAPAFCIYDAITDQPIRCFFKTDDISQVADLIKRRARLRVMGEAKYNQKHRPVSIDVESFEVLPEQADLPQLSDLHDAHIDITSGRDSVDFVRELRDAG
jgi:hypothetical protein